MDGVVQRAGADAAHRLWTDEDHLPTPAELDAPGLWLARVGIETTGELELDIDGGFEIPDYLDEDGLPGADPDDPASPPS
jgi:hypothetical protein